MLKNILSISFIILLAGKSVSAQDKPAVYAAFDNFATFAWDVNIPLGDKYVDATSYAGAKIEYRKMVTSNISIGTEIAWNSYYEHKPYQTYNYDANTDITTDLFTYNYTLPLALNAHYYFSTNSIFVPYAGLGLGAMYSTPRLYFNIYEIDEENWGFLVRPEIGTVIKFDKTAEVGVLVGARYSYATNNEEVFDITDLQSIGFQLGFVWLY